MSSKALEQGGKHDLNTFSSRLAASRRMLAEKVRTAGLLFPLLALAATAAFWSIVWLLDTTPVHALSPVNALLRIYGTGIAVMATLVIVGTSLWLIAKRLGYADRFTQVLFEHTDDAGPAPVMHGVLVPAAAAAPVAGYNFPALPASTPALLQLEAAKNDDGARPASVVTVPTAVETENNAGASPVLDEVPAEAAAPEPPVADPVPPSAEVPSTEVPAEVSVAEDPAPAAGQQGTASTPRPAQQLAKGNLLKKGKGRRK